MTEGERILSAEAYLKSPSGKSLVHSSEQITSQNIKDFLPSSQTVLQASHEFTNLGFAVEPRNTVFIIRTHQHLDKHPATFFLTLAASPDLFEEVFKMKLICYLPPAQKAWAQVVTPPTIPESLSNIVSDILFPRPANWAAQH